MVPREVGFYFLSEVEGTDEESRKIVTCGRENIVDDIQPHCHLLVFSYLTRKAVADFKILLSPMLEEGKQIVSLLLLNIFITTIHSRLEL